MLGMQVHALGFFLSEFGSIDNKGAKILFPKLKVAGSIPVTRPNFLQYFSESIFQKLAKR